MVGLISAVFEEGKEVSKHLKERSVVGGKQIFKGKIHDRDIAYVVSGIGKTNAAHATTILSEKFLPDVIVLFGVGGAYPSAGLRVGDIAIAEKEVYGDEGVFTGEGFRGADLIGIPFLKKGSKKYFNEFPLDKKLAKKAVKSLKLVTGFKTGTFVTVSTVTGTEKRARELQKRFEAICENMEGAAVAHISTMYGIPMLEIRGISNIVECRNKGKWDLKIAADNCQRVVMEVIKTLQATR
ncbi:MAG: futalosine hydrolase [Thermodesulfovibrionales bacterium]